MKLKNKKELKEFIDNRDKYINYLIFELNKYGISVINRADYHDKIDEIQKFYENEFLKRDIDVQTKLRLGFWAFFSEMVMNKLGGELIIASPSDYSAGTPQLINYGNKYDKKGEKKWIGIAFDSWLNTLLLGRLFGTLNETVSSLIDDYS
jgi:hypothetical protein